MRTILLFLFVFTSVLNASAQITLEQVFDPSDIGRNFFITDIGNNNSKYVFIDTIDNTFSLYNLDMTPFILDVSVPEPIMPDYTVAYITNTLFDCDDSNIEYVFMSYQNFTKPFRVLRTDGTVLLSVDSARGPVCYGCVAGTKEIVPIVNTQDGAKLLLTKFHPSTFIRKTLVYGLCGTLPQQNSVVNLNTARSLVNVFPNPADNAVTFEIQLPDNVNENVIQVFDANAKLIAERRLTSTLTIFSIDVKDLPGSTYYYSVLSSGEVANTGKFSVVK
jgi:DNA-binding beta-propeller fold protein YncE